MRILGHLFEKNRAWAERIAQEEPSFFPELATEQNPEYLWIGCADSRVPANQIIDALPGEIFEHRNVANVVVHTDFNCLSVLQYAVEVLRIKHVIVCGHYGCGGVKAAMETKSHGLIDNWLRNVKDVYYRHSEELMTIGDPEVRFNRLCEINVGAQVSHVCHTTIVQDAWKEGRELTVHGWVYGLKDGLLKDLDLCITGADQIPAAYLMD